MAIEKLIISISALVLFQVLASARAGNVIGGGVTLFSFFYAMRIFLFILGVDHCSLRN